jgi:hypothetical protein
LRKTLLAALCGTILSVHHAAAENAVAQAVQKLHLSPQQLLSLRDFLGPFNRGTDVESSGTGLFVLRDARSMAYTGEFSLRVGGDGSLQVDRVSGPATLDSTRDVRLPLRLDAKARAQVMAALAGSQLLIPRTAAAAPIVCTSTGEVLARKPGAPAYAAVTLCVPAGSELVVSAATPPTSATVPRFVAPSKNVTLPVGTA